MRTFRLLPIAILIGTVVQATAQLTIPSDGSDGALNITEDTVIDLSQAVTGTWDQNNASNAGHGVYDPDKWVVVFKYSSVNIQGHTTGTPETLVGRRVKFKNHPSNAPVVWLVQGNVTINGILDLNGQDGSHPSTSLANIPTEPGPGGFRGGVNIPSTAVRGGGGYGPAGGQSGYAAESNGRYALAYGNPQIIPLIGGSGGASMYNPSSGPAGGGAILIAAGNNILINGRILCNGGKGDISVNWGGSGGAIKLIADSVSGSGLLEAKHPNRADSVGRIRIEANALDVALQSTPETIAVPPANPPVLWPAENAPKARILSVDAVAAPEDPRSPLIAAADLAIQNNSPVNILIETRDFPIEGVVHLHVIPKFSDRTRLTATRVSGDINQAIWRVTTTLPQGFVTLQARATQP